jgi:hypothetical protein
MMILADLSKLTLVRDRVKDNPNLWMATVRPDGRPHVAPIWFVWYADRVYVMTGGVKLDNVRHNGQAALNTEDGNDVAIIEGTARVVPPDDPLFDTVNDLFKKKYDWDIGTSLHINQLIEIVPVKVLAWKA